MSTSQLEWWEKLAADEEVKVEQWESLSPEDYKKAAKTCAKNNSPWTT